MGLGVVSLGLDGEGCSMFCMSENTVEPENKLMDFKIFQDFFTDKK